MRALKFDEKTYLEVNPDVEAVVRAGHLRSGRHHYDLYGRDEGRPTTSRKIELLRGITKDMTGIEIGPYYAPLAPKREGYDCLSFDVFGTETLRQRATENATIDNDMIGNIEPVDIVGTASDLGSAVGNKEFDYVLSSHNFEHLPDPIRFLQGVEKVLKPNGFLSMALPNCQLTFDFFRWPTQTHEWIEAYREERKRPSLAQIFQEISMQADPTSDWTKNPKLKGSLAKAYDFWQTQEGTADYHDVHCSIFTPSSFELLILESNELGLTSLRCQPPIVHANEFVVRLTKKTMPQAYSTARRKLLMLKVLSEVASKACGLKNGSSPERLGSL